jgi:hypothetical protein
MQTRILQIRDQQIRLNLIALVALFVAGCGSTTTTDDPANKADDKTTTQSASTPDKRKDSGLTNVTFYLEGMNHRLKIL